MVLRNRMGKTLLKKSLSLLELISMLCLCMTFYTCLYIFLFSETPHFLINNFLAVGFGENLKWPKKRLKNRKKKEMGEGEEVGCLFRSSIIPYVQPATACQMYLTCSVLLFLSIGNSQFSSMLLFIVVSFNLTSLSTALGFFKSHSLKYFNVRELFSALQLHWI